MKKIILLILCFYTVLNIFSQEKDYAEIEFIPFTPFKKLVDSYKKDLVCRILLNDKLITTLRGEELLNFKIYTKGRISVAIFVNQIWNIGELDIKESKKYYYVLGQVDKKRQYCEISEQEAVSMKSKWNHSTQIELEEDISNPIGNVKSETPIGNISPPKKPK